MRCTIAADQGPRCVPASPSSATIEVDGEDYWAATEARRAAISRRFGVLLQSDALWSSMTVVENVALRVL